MPSISYAYGLFTNDNTLHGVLTFGTPASHPLVVGIAGEKFSKNVIELNRLYIDDEVSQVHKNVASQFVAYGLKQLKKYNKIVVSYADSGMNHIGYIYQACNFLYTGKTKARTDRFSGIGKHSRHYDKNAKQYFRVYRSPKYRYVYFTGDKRTKKEFLNALNYPIILDYPKGNDKHYTIGQTKPIKLLDMTTHQIKTVIPK